MAATGMLVKLLDGIERLCWRSRVRLRRNIGKSAQTDAPQDPEGWEKIYLGQAAGVTALQHPVAVAVAGVTAPGDVLLEAGCGSGALSAELALAGRVIKLCDFSDAILREAVRSFQASNLPAPNTTLADLTKPLPWADGTFDFVWSSGVLEHWTDDELRPIVREMARVSRKGVISLIPNARSVLYRLGKHLAEQHQAWPYGREMPRESLRVLFEEAGLRRIEERTIWPEAVTSFVGMTDPHFAGMAKRWWDSLSPEDPAKKGQGYLLLTVGYH